MYFSLVCASAERAAAGPAYRGTVKRISARERERETFVIVVERQRERDVQIAVPWPAIPCTAAPPAAHGPAARPTAREARRACPATAAPPAGLPSFPGLVEFDTVLVQPDFASGISA